MDWDDYYALLEANWLILEGRADDLLKVMPLLVNSNNEAAEKDLHLILLKVTSQLIQKGVNKWHHFYYHNILLTRMTISTTTTTTPTGTKTEARIRRMIILSQMTKMITLQVLQV